MSFQGFLKQSTAVDVLIGPFVDDTDGNTAEIGLTISASDVRLSKNGQNMASKNDATACVHDEIGMYHCEFDATDTNTVGQLVLSVHESGALLVKMTWHVVEEAVYDAMYGASAEGPLQATTAGRTLDVAATGEAGVDFGNVTGTLTNSNLAFVDSNERVDIGEWLGTAVTMSGNYPDVNCQDWGAASASMGISSGSLPQVDTYSIYDSSTVSANVALDYDGTGYNKSNSTIGTCTTNTDMRGTDSANTVVPMTAALSQTEHDATQSAITGLNDIAATDIVSAGAITTLSGAVVNVDLVDLVTTTTTNTDMRGTDSANTVVPMTAALSQTEHDATQSAIAGLNDPTIADIVDGVWDEAINKANHNVANSAAKYLRQIKQTVSVSESAVDDPGAAATTTVFNTELTEVDDFWNDLTLVFTTGSLEGQARVITDFANTNGQITIDEPLTSIPADNDEFIINSTHTHTLTQVAGAILSDGVPLNTSSGVLDTVNTVNTTTTNTDMRGTDSALLAASAPSNWSSMVISAGGAADSLVQGYLNNTIAESTANNISTNFEVFFDNADAVTTKTVDDVGGGGGGGGDATEAKQDTIITHLTDVKGTGFAKDTHSLTDITEDVTGLNGSAMRGTDSANTVVPMTAALSQTEHDATQATLAGLNDVAATDIVSAGAITTLSGAVVNVDLVDLVTTTTTNTDMRGTDGANTVVPMTATLSQTEHDATQSTLAGLNDVAATDIVSAGAITTLSGAVVNVDLVATTTTNTDMRGTDSANTVVPMTASLSQTEHDATQTAIIALNNIAATDIVSAGAITTLSGAVVNVDLVDTTTTNTDMRGTDGANTVVPMTAALSQTEHDASQSAIAALNDLSVSDIFTTALTEAYRSTGAAGTAAELLYEIIAHLGESSIVSTTKTLKKLDGSTPAKTYTLNDATEPTSITETT